MSMIGQKRPFLAWPNRQSKPWRSRSERPLRPANMAFGLAAAHVGWHDFLQLTEAIKVPG